MVNNIIMILYPLNKTKEIPVFLIQENLKKPSIIILELPIPNNLTIKDLDN